jgi:hypothetical protein
LEGLHQVALIYRDAGGRSYRSDHPLTVRLADPGSETGVPHAESGLSVLPSAGTMSAGTGIQATAQGGILAITHSRIYPNPFNPFSRNAVIAFDLSRDAEVEIIAYDWVGEFVDTVYKGSASAGTNRVEWGGQTEDGRKLGNGVYLIRIVACTGARKEAKVLKAVVWNDG